MSLLVEEGAGSRTIRESALRSGRATAGRLRVEAAIEEENLCGEKVDDGKVTDRVKARNVEMLFDQPTSQHLGEAVMLVPRAVLCRGIRNVARKQVSQGLPEVAGFRKGERLEAVGKDSSSSNGVCMPACSVRTLVGRVVNMRSVNGGVLRQDTDMDMRRAMSAVLDQLMQQWAEPDCPGKSQAQRHVA